MVQECPFFVNVHAIETVKASPAVGGQKKPKSCQRRSLFFSLRKNQSEFEFPLFSYKVAGELNLIFPVNCFDCKLQSNKD